MTGSSSRPAALPMIVGHRGASHDAPENTVAAFDLAWRQGADAIEGDFRLTRDGAVVCLHDDTTERVATRALAPATATLAELRELDLGSWRGPAWAGTRMPTLGEVLATVPRDRRLFIELKSGLEILGPLCQVLAASGLRPEQLAIIVFDGEVLARAKQALPALKMFWLTELKHDAASGEWRPSGAELVAKVNELGVDGVDCSVPPAVDETVIEPLHDAGLEFHVWTVDETPLARRLAALGVDSLTTNRPGWLRQQLGMPPAAR